MLRDTAQAIEDVFGQGGALLSALETITTSGWCPGKLCFWVFIFFFVNLETVKLIISDQLSDYNKLFNKELVEINDSYSKDLITAVPNEKIKEKCSQWLKQFVLLFL